MTSYLANRIECNKILLIGTANTFSIKAEDPIPESCSAIYNQIGIERFFLDLRKTPSGVTSDWLNTKRFDRLTGRCLIIDLVCARNTLDILRSFPSPTRG